MWQPFLDANGDAVAARYGQTVGTLRLKMGHAPPLSAARPWLRDEGLALPHHSGEVRLERILRVRKQGPPRQNTL